MKIVRFQTAGTVKYGIVEGDVVRGMKHSPFSDHQGPGDAFPLDGTVCPLAQTRLLAPCVPSKYVGIGINYHKAAEEKGTPLPQKPIIFLKPSTSVIGPEEEIVLPDPPGKVVHEAELALVIGKKAKDVPEDRVKDYLMGYTCTNDLTDFSAFEKDGGNPTRAKGRDTFGPVGPWIETEVDTGDLRVEAYVNGKLCQSGRTSDLIFKIDKIVSFLSGIMTLLPGDIIATGTPAGGAPLNPGDVVEVRVEKIGTLRNAVAGSK